jgi:hypothetical protein
MKLAIQIPALKPKPVSHSFRSVLRKVHSLFQSQYTTECDLVLRLSIYSAMAHANITMYIKYF